MNISLENFEVKGARNGILTPGIHVLKPGVKRFPIPGGGSRTVEIDSGDQIAVMDIEGGQLGELVFFNPKGKSDASMIGQKGTGAPSKTIKNLSSGGMSGKKVLTALKKANFNIEKGDAVPIFGKESKAGTMLSFEANSDGILICSSIGESMSPENQDTPTELILYLKKFNHSSFTENFNPPDPLSDPTNDINIQPGHAKSYSVKKGDYIQIVDVQGRECSDFQAFSTRALDKGVEREICPTTTRSLGGALYPLPGIFSKYWTVDHEPLVEIIQDTCGRHDTFGLACTARYYEDLGYPGHINCSDNMNLDLQQYNIKPRGGWPAINFFFNTLLDDLNGIGMDDPWSRPGDFVLMRALTDLVCVSSACPCDVDPANGWNPTDIQVRTYSSGNEFKKSIGYRKSAEHDMEETKNTGFHNNFGSFTRNFIEYNGYWLANDMTNYGAIAEYWGCRERAALMDLSPLRKYEVTGPDAKKLMDFTVTRNMEKLAVGQVVYTAMCYHHGGMIDDGTVFRLGENNFRWVGGNDTSGLWLREQSEKLGLNAWVRNSTDQLCNIALQGPKSRDILKKVFWTPPTQATVEELGWFRFTIARTGDYKGVACVISRTGYTGELGFEVFCHPKDAQKVFEKIWNAGKQFDMVPLGLEALNLLRVEAGLIFAGYEFSDQIDPFEAGISFTVPLKSKTTDFIGKEELIGRKENPQKKLVGLEIEGGLVPSTGDCIRVGKAQVGEITSAVKSPILEKTIALARVNTLYSKLETKLEIGQLDGFQKRLSAKVVKFPHFDPLKERVKGNY